jgi:hypothetical protein
MPTLSDVILGLAVMVAVPVEGIPHQGQMGGKVVGLPPGRHVPPKAEDARIVSVQEFQQLSVADRRGILAAWLEKGPLTAGEALLPIVKVAFPKIRRCPEPRRACWNIRSDQSAGFCGRSAVRHQSHPAPGCDLSARSAPCVGSHRFRAARVGRGRSPQATTRRT